MCITCQWHNCILVAVATAAVAFVFSFVLIWFLFSLIMCSFVPSIRDRIILSEFVHFHQHPPEIGPDPLCTYRVKGQIMLHNKQPDK